MKVYVIIEVWYSRFDLIACYRTKEDAEKYTASLSNSRNFSIIEMDVK